MTLHHHLIVVCGCVLSGSAFGALTDGLAAYYDFESGIEDQSGHGRHLLVATGNPEPAWGGGTVTRGAASIDRDELLAGRALNLVDEDNDVLKAPLGSGPSTTTAGTHDLGGNFTISAWHLLAPLPNNASTRYFVFEGEDNYDVSWGIASNEIYVAYVAQTAAGALSLPQQAWHHVAHVFKTSGNEMTIDLYVNGLHVNSMSTSAAGMDLDRIVFGDARDVAGDREWDGLLDEIAIWERALSAVEVRELHERGRAGLGLLTDPAAAGKAIIALAAGPAGGGTVSPAWALVNTGFVQAVEARPTPGWRFTGWSGGFDGQTAMFSHMVTAPIASAASFEHDLSDPDHDGMTTYDELTLHGTAPDEADSDHDGLMDDDEIFITRTNPRANDAALVAAFDNAYSQATSGRLALTPAEGRAAGSGAHVSFGFLQSTNGVSWAVVSLDQAVLESLSPGSRLRLRFPTRTGAPGLWRVLPQVPDEEH